MQIFTDSNKIYLFPSTIMKQNYAFLINSFLTFSLILLWSTSHSTSSKEQSYKTRGSSTKQYNSQSKES